LSQDVADRKGGGNQRVVESASGNIDQLRRRVDAVDNVASACQLDRISARSATRIEKAGARKDAAFDQPGRHRRAFLADRTIDQEIERPRVLGIERSTGILGHLDEDHGSSRCHGGRVRRDLG
jgi:hypothetical protein